MKLPEGSYFAVVEHHELLAGDRLVIHADGQAERQGQTAEDVTALDPAVALFLLCHAWNRSMPPPDPAIHRRIGIWIQAGGKEGA